VQQDSRAKAGVAGLVDGFAEAAMTSLRQLRERLEPAALEQAAKVLAQADTIYLIGQRRSFPIVTYLAYAFGKLGLRHMLMDGVGGLGPEQVAC
ncbi:MurR/RpiR family transcriptional regulator, partial [Escherichia coli]